MAPKITENELLAELARYCGGSAPEDAKTVEELTEVANLSSGTVLKLLKVLQRQGRVQVYRVRRARIDGVVQPKPAYAVTPAKRK